MPLNNSQILLFSLPVSSSVISPFKHSLLLLNMHYFHILCCLVNLHSFALDLVGTVILPTSYDLKIFKIYQTMVQTVFIHNDLDSL